MAIEGQEQFETDNFSKGIIRSDDMRNIPESASPDTHNTRFIGQVWTSRPGFESYLDELSIDTGFDGLNGWVGNDSLIGFHEGKLYKSDEVGNEWDQIADLSFTTGTEVGSIEYLDDIYIGNAVQDFTRVQGTSYTVTAIPSNPKGNIFEVWGEKMWVAGVSLYPRTLYYSDTALADSPEKIFDFGGGTSGSELMGKQGYITGLSTTKDALIIFKNNETYYIKTFIETTLAPSIQELSSTLGCVGRKAHARVRDDVYFFTGSEIRTVSEYQGYPNLYTAPISDDVKALIKDDLAEDQGGAVMNFNDKDNLLKLWVKSTDSPVNDLCLVYHLENKTWTIDTGKTASRAVTFKDKTYWSAETFGQAYLDETGLNDDDGEVFSYRWSKDRKMYSAKGQKKFREYYIAGSMLEGSNPLVELYIDGRLIQTIEITDDDITDIPESLGGSVGVDRVGQNPWAGIIAGKKRFQKRVRFNSIGRYIQSYVEMGTAGGYIEITDEVIRYIPLPRMAERI